MLKAFAGGRVFGEQHGSATPWVLALPGWGRTSADYRSVLRRSADPGDPFGGATLDAVALDLPGFGATPPPERPWGSPDYAALVGEVLAEMAERVVVLGHSRGGVIAVHVALHEPERVGALVLTGAPLVRLETAAARPAVAYRLVRRLRRLGLVTEARLEAARQRHGSADYRAATGVMRQVLVGMLAEDHADELARVRQPVELVWGELDTAAPVAVAERAERALARATLTVLPGIGHDVPAKAPEALRQALARLAT